MKIFKLRRKYRKLQLLDTHKVAPIADFEADEYSAIMRIQLQNEDGTTEDVEVRMGLKQLHQLTTNLYITCRTFNLPVGDPLADRARGFYGMRP